MFACLAVFSFSEHVFCMLWRTIGWVYRVGTHSACTIVLWSPTNKVMSLQLGWGNKFYINPSCVKISDGLLYFSLYHETKFI